MIIFTKDGLFLFSLDYLTQPNDLINAPYRKMDDKLVRFFRYSSDQRPAECGIVYHGDGQYFASSFNGKTGKENKGFTNIVHKPLLTHQPIIFGGYEELDKELTALLPYYFSKHKFKSDKEIHSLIRKLNIQFTRYYSHEEIEKDYKTTAKLINKDVKTKKK